MGEGTNTGHTCSQIPPNTHGMKPSKVPHRSPHWKHAHTGMPHCWCSLFAATLWHSHPGTARMGAAHQKSHSGFHPCVFFPEFILTQNMIIIAMQSRNSVPLCFMEDEMSDVFVTVGIPLVPLLETVRNARHTGEHRHICMLSIQFELEDTSLGTTSQRN